MKSGAPMVTPWHGTIGAMIVTALRFASLLAAAGAATSGAQPPRVSDYKVATGWIEGPRGRAPLVALRAFVLDGKACYLGIEPTTLATRIVAAEGTRLQPALWQKVRAALSATPYGRALAEAEGHESAPQGAGLSHLRAVDGISLTVDLCPSRHPLDRRLFSELLREMGAWERPVPVAIAITGSWMNAHPRDLAWLLALEREGRVELTWINHSYGHRVDPAAPLARNFLLEPGTDVAHEVLATEAALIERGITPSAFFRFPGLVSRPALVRTITDLGLVPTGSDAWLAKGQTARPGSIVLVHGTGNEPVGIRRFIDLLRSERAAVRAGRWSLLDLRETVAEGESHDEAPATRAR